MEQGSNLVIGAGITGLSAGCHGQMRGFYMAGQWVEPGGGVLAVAMPGRNVIQILCRRDGERFRSGA